MDIRNGKLVLNEPYILSPTIQDKATTYTDNHTVTLEQTGQLLIMDSGSEKTFTLPSIDASDIGKRFPFASTGAGKCILAPADADTIDDSTASSGHISATSSAGVITTISIEVVSVTEYAILQGANGTWTTT